MKYIKEKFGLRNDVYVFINKDTAFRFADRATKSSVVLYGDGNRYWVAYISDAMKLHKLGYQIVK
jgi:hypothetical protein